MWAYSEGMEELGESINDIMIKEVMQSLMMVERDDPINTNKED